MMPWCPAPPYCPGALCPDASVWHNGTKDSLGFQNDMHPSSVTRDKSDEEDGIIKHS